MRLSPDQLIFWEEGFVKINATIVFTWGLMVVMVVGAFLITRNFSLGSERSRWQNLVEMVVITILDQIREVGIEDARRYLPFLGTLFLFIGIAALGTILPFYQAPTGSLSTTIALALCVLIAVPLYGVQERGILGYLRTYLQPTPIMLPFNIIGEMSRTIALSVRLFGNMMSGSMILAILLTITPFIFPVIMTLLGLLTGMVQAYIFTILAAVYLAAATTITHQSKLKEERG